MRTTICRMLGRVRKSGACLALGAILATGGFAAGGHGAAFAMESRPSPDSTPALLGVPATTTGEPGAIVQVPITVDPGDGILGIDLTVTYATAVLQARSVTATGIAAAAGFALVTNLDTPGVIRISTYATGHPLGGSGELARIQFRVLGSPGASSPLKFTSASINEGQVTHTFRDGVFTAAATTAVLSLPVGAQGGSGTTVQVPISASPADGILGIDMVVHYDSAVLLAQSVTVSGIAATAGFAVASNPNTPGVVVISTYATTNALHGSGEILRIGFLVPGAPGSMSSLTFASASINEGAIPVAFSQGSFTVNCAGAADGLSCDDGNPFTCGDVCGGGVCAGIAVPEPAEVNGSVRVAQSGADATISWNDPPGPFNVYRGTLAGATPFFTYNQVCLDPGGPIPGPSVIDSLVPPLGTGFFYLVTRVDQCRESIPGRDSSGAPMPNSQACPAASR